MAVNSIIMSGIAMLQLLLLTLDEYNYTIWYISRGIEVSSKLFVVSFLIYNIFQELATLQQTGSS